MAGLIRIAADGASPGQLAKAFEALDQHFTKSGCSAVEAATAAFRLEGEESLTEHEFKIAQAWFAADNGSTTMLGHTPAPSSVRTRSRLLCRGAASWAPDGSQLRRVERLSHLGSVGLSEK